MLGLQRACGLDEKAREAAVVEADACDRGDGDRLDRGAERVAALMKDANLPALKPRDGHDIVGGVGERRVDDERPREMRADPVLDTDLGDL